MKQQAEQSRIWTKRKKTEKNKYKITTDWNTGSRGRRTKARAQQHIWMVPRTIWQKPKLKYMHQLRGPARSSWRSSRGGKKTDWWKKHWEQGVLGVWVFVRVLYVSCLGELMLRIAWNTSQSHHLQVLSEHWDCVISLSHTVTRLTITEKLQSSIKSLLLIKYDNNNDENSNNLTCYWFPKIKHQWGWLIKA